MSNTMIPSGSVIERVYFEVEPFPGGEPVGAQKFDKVTEALDAAADYWVGRREVYREQGLPERPPFPTIVERWFIREARPRGAKWDSSTTDMPITSDTLNETAIMRSRVSRGLEY